MTTWYKLPPVSGFSLFYKISLQNPDIVSLVPSARGTAIMELWSSLKPEQRKNYIDRAQIENTVKQELIAEDAATIPTYTPPVGITTVYPGDKCCVCRENEPTTLNHPCGHIAFCRTCLGDRLPTTCAMCRAHVISIIDIAKFRSPE